LVEVKVGIEETQVATPWDEEMLMSVLWIDRMNVVDEEVHVFLSVEGW